MVAYEFLAKGFSRQHIATNESKPADSLVGQALGVEAKPPGSSATPAESYGFDNKLLAWETIAPLVDNCSPLRTSHLRDPVGPEMHFASESFIDELAAAAGEDPVAFRLQIPQQSAPCRGGEGGGRKGEMEAARCAATREREVGRGISFAERNGTAVAAIAEVEVDRASGRVWARRFCVAHDCGLIINPMGLRQTIEGNVVQGTSRALLEEVRFDRDSVKSVDWASYPILEMADAPESIEIVLIDRPEVAPCGAGEPPSASIPAALANAVFDATGVRMRKAPLSPERVKAALGAT